MSIRVVLVSSVLALGLLTASGGYGAKPEQPGDAPAQKKTEGQEKKQRTAEVLVHNEVLATFEGVKFHKCPGRTALCPDRCGDSGEMAEFTIVKYLKYEKLGQFGDDKQQEYTVQISDFHKKPIGDPKIRATINGLKQGDEVLISWDHLRVTEQGSTFPKRTLVKLERASKEDKARAESTDSKKQEAEPSAPPATAPEKQPTAKPE